MKFGKNPELDFKIQKVPKLNFETQKIPKPYIKIREIFIICRIIMGIIVNFEGAEKNMGCSPGNYQKNDLNHGPQAQSMLQS